MARRVRENGVAFKTGALVYDLTYVYDDAGNRLQKIDAVNEDKDWQATAESCGIPIIFVASADAASEE